MPHHLPSLGAILSAALLAATTPSAAAEQTNTADEKTHPEKTTSRESKPDPDEPGAGEAPAADQKPAKPARAADPAAAIQRTGPGRYRIPRAAIYRALPLATLSLRRLPVKKVRRSGKLLGYRLPRVRPGSLVHRAGLRSGDVVTRIGGQRLPQTASQYLALPARDRVTIDLIRNNKPHRLSYTITGD
jgi:hypothetical protein